jgi:hypothetical protein
MSSLRTVLVEDSRLDISDSATFSVKSDAAQSTFQPYLASSVSSSNITFAIQIPSENIVLDREVYLDAELTLKFTATMPDADCAQAPALVMDYGNKDALQAYPLNSLFLTTQCTINNASVSENTQDIMAPLLSLYDKRHINRYNSMAPTMIDSTYGKFEDGTNGVNNVLGAATSGALDKNFVGRGAHPAQIVDIVHTWDQQIDPNDPNEPGNFSLVALAGSTGNTWTFYLKTVSTEPFLALSPFLNVTPDYERAGLMGINNMAFVLNMDTSCKRVFSTATSEVVDNNLVPKYIQSISIQKQDGSTGLDNVRLLMNFLSMSPEQMAKLPSPKNVVPYVTYPRYLSNGATSAAIAAGASSTVSTQSIQLSMIPDKLLIVARVPMSKQNAAQANAFLTIEGVSVTFNNASGLLASATQNDLYSKVSYVNGSGQSWPEFSGEISVHDAATGKPTLVPGLGSVLVLEPTGQFALPSYLAASSLGQFQFQAQITLKNQFNWAIQPEICIIAMNSGVFSTVAGTSQIFTGMLSREAVLSAKSGGEAKMSSGDAERLVGGRLGSSVMKRRIGGVGMSGGGGMSGGASKPTLSRLY